MTPGIIEGLFWVALNVYFESRDQPKVARQMVAHVTLNRKVKRKLSLKEVVREPYQFSWLNEGKIPPIKEVSVFLDCIQVAVYCWMRHKVGLRMAGVNFFYDDSLAGNPPYWAKDMKPLGKVGAFYIFKG